MSSRSAAKKLTRPASKPVTKSAPKKSASKLAKVTRFPTAQGARRFTCAHGSMPRGEP